MNLRNLSVGLRLGASFGAILLIALALLVHYWKRIILLFTPFLGEFGKSLEARWRKPKTEETAG